MSLLFISKKTSLKFNIYKNTSINKLVFLYIKLSLNCGNVVKIVGNFSF